MENAVEIKNLVKEFDIYHETASLIGLIFFGGKKTRFSALKGIDLNIEKGKTIGITGPNGSGKTTLLKILSGTLYPTSGEIQLNGKVSSILELGAGFHPELTGRENIYLNALLLGFKKEEIEEKYNSIVKFADIGSFIDTKVKTFSSGMYLRLGFSIAIHADFDILLIDEILAVGDVDFQAKCIQKLKHFQEEGKTIIIVSHNKNLLRQICNQTYFMKQSVLKVENTDSDNIEKKKIETRKPPVQDNEILWPSHEEEYHFNNYVNFDVTRKLLLENNFNNGNIIISSEVDSSMFFPGFNHFNINLNSQAWGITLKTNDALDLLGGNYFNFLGLFDYDLFISEILPNKTTNVLVNFGLISYSNPEKNKREFERSLLDFCEKKLNIVDIEVKEHLDRDMFNDKTLIDKLTQKGYEISEFFALTNQEWLLYSMIINHTYNIVSISKLYRRLNTIINNFGYSVSRNGEGMSKKFLLFSKTSIVFDNLVETKNKVNSDKFYIKLSEVYTSDLLEEEKEIVEQLIRNKKEICKRLKEN